MCLTQKKPPEAERYQWRLSSVPVQRQHFFSTSELRWDFVNSALYGWTFLWVFWLWTDNDTTSISTSHFFSLLGGVGGGWRSGMAGRMTIKAGRLNPAHENTTNRAFSKHSSSTDAPRGKRERKHRTNSSISGVNCKNHKSVNNLRWLSRRKNKQKHKEQPVKKRASLSHLLPLEHTGTDTNNSRNIRWIFDKLPILSAET